MPLGIVDDAAFAEELNRNVPSAPSAEIIDIKKGRGEVTELPDSLRKVIGDCALVENNDTVAETFSVSRSSVSAYKVGATSTASYHEPDKDLKEHVDDSRKRISKRAQNKLMLALGGLTKEKLANQKARDLAGIAKDMSAVIRNMEPPQDNEDKGAAKFVFFAPTLKLESHYPVIQVNE